LGDGKFADVTEQSGLKIVAKGWDVRRGILTTMEKRFGSLLRGWRALFRNTGDGKFVDVTQSTGIKREKGCVALTFVDYDTMEIWICT